MNREKSHVALTKCFFCGKDDKIVLHKRLGDVSEMHGKVIDMDPCQDCRTLMKKGIIVIGFDESKSDMTDPQNPGLYRSGQWFVMTDDGFERYLTGLGVDARLIKHGLKQRFMFMPGNVIDQTIGDQLKQAPTETGP